MHESGRHSRWTLALGFLLSSFLGSAHAADQVDIVTLPQGSVAHGVGVALAGVVSQKSPIRMVAAAPILSAAMPATRLPIGTVPKKAIV